MDQPTSRFPLVVVVTEVSGAGKSTTGRAFAERLGWPFEDGDALHPTANVTKLRSGTPLTDLDLLPWLEAVAEFAIGKVDDVSLGLYDYGCESMPSNKRQSAS
jgi:carbohydrate kinase (thermoresistant glucokinase family)